MGPGEEVPRPPLDLIPASLSAARSGRNALELYLARYDDQGGEPTVSVGGAHQPPPRVVFPAPSELDTQLALPSSRAPLDRVDGNARRAPPEPPARPAIKPEALRRLDERLCAGLRVASSSALTPSTRPRHLPGGRIRKPLLPWVRSAPSSELLHRHEWPDDGRHPRGARRGRDHGLSHGRLDSRERLDNRLGSTSSRNNRINQPSLRRGSPHRRDDSSDDDSDSFSIGSSDFSSDDDDDDDTPRGRGPASSSSSEDHDLGTRSSSSSRSRSSRRSRLGGKDSSPEAAAATRVDALLERLSLTGAAALSPPSSRGDGGVDDADAFGRRRRSDSELSGSPHPGGVPSGVPRRVPSGVPTPPSASSSSSRVRPEPRIPESERRFPSRNSVRERVAAIEGDERRDGREEWDDASPTPISPVPTPSPVVGADDAFEESQTPTTRPPRAESMSRSPGIIGQPDSPATPATRRTAISKMRKHELVEELNERGMETGGVVKELRDRLRAAREAGA